MMMMNCFCGMVDRPKAFGLIYSQDHSLPEVLTIVNPRHAVSRIEPVQNLNSGFVEWSCAIVIITTPRRHYNQYIKKYQIRN